MDEWTFEVEQMEDGSVCVTGALADGRWIEQSADVITINMEGYLPTVESLKRSIRAIYMVDPKLAAAPEDRLRFGR